MYVPYKRTKLIMSILLLNELNYLWEGGKKSIKYPQSVHEREGGDRETERERFKEYTTLATVLVFHYITPETS